MKIPKPRRLKSGNYNITLRLDGQNYSITRSTPTECKREAELLKAEYRNGKRKKRVDVTLGSVIDNFIESRSKVLSPSTINSYRSIRKTRFQSYMDTKVSDIKDWQKVVNTEVDTEITPKTLKNAWALVSSSLKYAGAEQPDIRLPQVMQSTRPWLDADQIRIFIKAVHGHPVEIPALLMLHSLRRSEVLGLDWSNINLQAKTINIVETAVIGDQNKLVYKNTTKTKKSYRTIPIMIPELEAALNAIPEEERTGKLYKKNPSNLREQINLICKKNNLPQTGCHGLRHSFCSLAAHVGMSEAECMLLGGWEDIGTMRNIYQHIADKDRLKTHNRLTAFFQNVYENVYETENTQ